MYSAVGSSGSKQGALLSANVIATEAISNIRTVAAYVKESVMVERYAVELRKPKESGFKYSAFLGLLTAVGQFGVMGANALCT